MPLINGRKYSCEPCVRGHRATSCLHTDRVLVEVRKPGRPLQTCGHKLASCSCGRVAESLSMSNGTSYLSRYALPPILLKKVMRSLEREEMVTVTARASSVVRAKPTSRSRSHSRQSKKARMQNQSPDGSIGSGTQNEVLQLELPPPPILLPSINIQSKSCGCSSPYSAESQQRYSTSPPGSAPSISDLLNEEPFSNDLPPIRYTYDAEQSNPSYHYTPSPPFAQRPATEMILPSSRIEDVSMDPHGGPHTQVRSQYITGSQIRPWNATQWQ